MASLLSSPALVFWTAAMQELLPVFASAMSRAGLKPGDRLGIALSGGRDSLALAAPTAAWSRSDEHRGAAGRAAPELHALVVDHALRPESEQEAQQALQLASALGLEPHLLRCTWPQGVPRPGDVQTAARSARYQLLQAACERHACTALLSGHQAGMRSAREAAASHAMAEVRRSADDTAESFLLRLSRASSLAGLRGMEPVRSLQPGLALVRPLLGAWRSQLADLCTEQGLQWVDDPTNSSLVYVRNLLRHHLQVRHMRLQPLTSAPEVM